MSTDDHVAKVGGHDVVLGLPRHVVVEAGVHGTPTVAFRHAGGPADSIRHGETGLLVGDQACGDEMAQFAETLARLLEDHDLRARMSHDVRAWVSRFHWDDCVRTWEELLTREVER